MEPVKLGKRVVVSLTTAVSLRFNMNCFRSIQSGFTLIELVVALLIFSIGFLALAKLQLENLHSSRDALKRSQLNTAMTELVERMRTNLPAVRDGHYQYSSRADGLPQSGSDCAPDNPCQTSLELASYDLREWLYSIDQTLVLLNNENSISPDSYLLVCRDSTPSNHRPNVLGANIDCDGLLNQWTIYIDWIDYSQSFNEQRIQRQTLSFIP